MRIFFIAIPIYREKQSQVEHLRDSFVPLRRLIMVSFKPNSGRKFIKNKSS